MSKFVYLIEEECSDPYFEPNVVGVFSTIEKARKALKDYKFKEECKIVVVKIDSMRGDSE